MIWQTESAIFLFQLGFATPREYWTIISFPKGPLGNWGQEWDLTEILEDGRKTDFSSIWGRDPVPVAAYDSLDGMNSHSGFHFHLKNGGDSIDASLDNSGFNNYRFSKNLIKKGGLSL